MPSKETISAMPVSLLVAICCWLAQLQQLPPDDSGRKSSSHALDMANLVADSVPPPSSRNRNGLLVLRS